MADSVIEGSFTLPYDGQLPLDVLFEKLSNKYVATAHYVQSQNDNLNGEWSPLLKDLPTNFSFATNVLGEPDASIP